MSIASTPQPPYYAVIFTSVRTNVDEGYSETAERMLDLAKQMPGFLGEESARNDIGITVSYWASLEDIAHWKKHSEHQFAQQNGRDKWYSAYKTRICKVERDYEFG
jgi:heme-degrading monooxygenase HmoA